jgi:uncharacterized protein YaaW (UPF0174 family)
MAIIQDCISEVVDKMEYEEKGILKCILLYGKKVQEKAADIISSSEELKKFGEDVTSDWVALKLQNEFTEGIGVVDSITRAKEEYGSQLDIVIKKILVKSLKTKRPVFSKPSNSISGALQREEWIVEKLMDSVITNMDEYVKQELVKQVQEMLKKKGVNPANATEASTALLTGGLTAARALLGPQFNILIVILTNLIIGTFLGRGLTVAANIVLQRFLGLFLGPVGWAITAATALPLITSLVNPRGYDKYIPAVFIIGLKRISQNE